MARAVKDPLLKDLPAGGVELDRAGIGHAAWRLAMRHRLGQRRLLPCLGDDMVAVDRVDGPVGIAMEDDGRHRPSFTPRPNRPAPAHGGEGRRHVPGRAAGQPRMDADGRKNIRIGGRHDRRRCTASRETRHIDSSRVGGELLDDLYGDASGGLRSSRTGPRL